MIELNEISRMVHENAKEHGFHPTEEHINVFLANQINNLHGEVSELWEAFRAGEFNKPTIKNITVNNHMMTNAEEEYADIIIRVLDQMERLGLNPEACILAKHGYNVYRPYKHGKLN